MRTVCVHNFDQKKIVGGKWPTGRLRHRLPQDIEVDIAGLGRQSLGWINEA